MEREKYPEAWIGKAVNIHGAPHAMGVLRDVNEYGITYETVETVPRPELRFVPWWHIRDIGLSQRQPQA